MVRWIKFKFGINNEADDGCCLHELILREEEIIGIEGFRDKSILFLSNGKNITIPLSVDIILQRLQILDKTILTIRVK